MFEDSLVESAALLRTRNRWPALLSIAAQLCAAALILTLPLLHPELLPMPHILSATLAPPRPPVQTPPPLHLEARPAPAATAAPSAPNSPRTQIFRDLIHPAGATVDAPALTAIDLGITNASLPPGINSAAPAAPHVSVSPAASAASSKRLSLSSGVTAGHLISDIRPDYPQIARITHTEGTVVIEAIISRTGTIENAHVLSGPPTLQQAALAAVRQARYRPFLLNGQPTEVQTTITIVFRMSS